MVILVIILIVILLVYFSTYHPKDVQEEPVICSEDVPYLKIGQKVKILNWNLQFLAGNQNNHVFYDGGKDAWPSQNTIDATLKKIAHILSDEDADILLLQELDFGSRRTHFENQLSKLLKLLPKEYSSYASTFYWKAWFIPHPGIYGSIGMKLAVISKYKMNEAFRYSLSPITTDNFIVKQFKPKRAILEVLFPIEEGGELHAMTVHLSAFSKGTDTMERQVGQVDKILSKMEQEGNFGFIGGDFNLLPPGKAFSRLGREQEYYNPTGSEIKPLFDKFKPVPTYAELEGENYKDWYTHTATSSPEKKPDKTIDYVFFTKAVDYGEHYIRSKDTSLLSDHSPLIVCFYVPGK